MQALLKASRAIDWLGEWIGRIIIWLVLGAVLISAGNAVVRKAFQVSSNAFLEIQWYLFATVFMLGAGYAFLRNAHVRIDFLSAHFPPKIRAWIDIAGIVVFLGPFCLLMINVSWPIFANAWVSGEMSQNAGGLIRWPVYLLIPAGMALLLLQATSELIKRFAFLRGLVPDPLSHGQATHPSEEQIAGEIGALKKNEEAR
jgi:TRAP-type mannitol/chloroaromatic compound transport system permease small subunit